MATVTEPTFAAAEVLEEDAKAPGPQALMAEMDVKSNEISSSSSAYLRVFSYADTTSWLLNISALVCAIGAGATMPLMDLIFGRTVTTFTSFGQSSIQPDQFVVEATNWTLVFIYLFIGKFVLTYIWSFCLNISAVRTTKALRIHFLQQIMRQDLAFYDKNDSGSVSIHITTNGNLINNGISEKLGVILQGVSTFITAFVIAFVVNWKLTLITMAVVPAILVTTYGFLAIEIGIEEKVLSFYAKAGQLAEEVFGSVRTIHAFWAAPALSEKYAGCLQDARKQGLRKNILYGFFYAVEYFVIYAGYGLAFWQGTRRYASGEIAAPGDVVTVIFAVVLAATALTQILPHFVHISKATSAAAGLFAIIDRKPEIDSLDSTGERPHDCSGNIELQNIHFSYPTRPNVPVLKGIDLNLPAGKTTAIVGASGSGKSTIVGLLERWYNPTSGSITMDGRSIKEINLEWLRTKIRVVQQEPVLFNQTIFKNVVFGLVGTEWQNIPEDEQMKLVVDACKRANAHDFIKEQPEGYYTLVGERAGRLSGGQKQRIAIARSIISNPKVLLLDEATSALDPKAERIVQDVLDSVSKTRTTLIIAHKLSTVRKADNIVVMREGIIVEKGSHEKLMEKNGAYAALVDAQDLGTRIDSDPEKERPEMARLNTKQSAKAASELIPGNKGNSSSRGLIYLLLRIFRENSWLWPQFAGIGITCVLGGCAFPAAAVIFSKAMDVFTLTGSELTKQGNFWALMFFVVALVVFFVYFALGFFSNQVSQHLTYDYRLGFFDDVARQDMAYFDEPENTTGAIVSRLSSLPTQLQDLLSTNVVIILLNIVSILSSSILAIAIAWKIGLVVVFGGLTVITCAGYLRIRLETKLDDATGQKFADSAALAAEATSAIRTVSSLALERTILKEYQGRLAHIEKQTVKSIVWTMFWFSLTQSVSLLSMALGFWYGATRLAAGEYTLEQFYTAFVAVLFSGEGAASIFQFTKSMTEAVSAANYVFELKDSKPSIHELSPEKGEPPVVSEKGAELAFENVRFTYPARPDIEILRGVTTSASPGRSIAFVGPSGCGKTTMLGLAMRFYDVNSGCVSFAGEDVICLCPRKLRSHIALVSQEPTLYSGSVRDNVALGVEGRTTDEEIEKACMAANIHEFVISLPEGYGTPCGGRGSSLSGGQRQRIAIARALIRKPKLLLLDEATSALDTASERIVQTALERGREGCTTIAVAHRLSTIRDYNTIFVFSSGKIVESGTHQGLLSRQGVYYEMCLGQGLDSG